MGFRHWPCWKVVRKRVPSFITLAVFLPLTGLPKTICEGGHCWRKAARLCPGHSMAGTGQHPVGMPSHVSLIT